MPKQEKLESKRVRGLVCPGKIPDDKEPLGYRLCGNLIDTSKITKPQLVKCSSCNHQQIYVPMKG